MTQRNRPPNLWVGILLIGLGLFFLLDQFQVFDLGPVWKFWPLLLLGLGVARLAGYRGHRRWSGYWIFVAGLYCAAGTWNFLGLTWDNAWPIFVVAAGVSILARPGRECRPEVRLDR
jgi:hypothetical protein